MSRVPRRRARRWRPMCCTSYDWSETSLIVELFTREQGRVVVVAKGAKRPYVALAAVLLPFPAPAGAAGPRAGRRTVRGAQPAQRRVGRRPAAAGRRRCSAASTSTSCCSSCWRGRTRTRRCSTPMPTRCRRWPMATTPEAEPVLRAFELLLLRELGVLPELASATLTAQPLHAGRATRCTPKPAWSKPSAAEGACPGCCCWVRWKPRWPRGQRTRHGAARACAARAGRLRGPAARPASLSSGHRRCARAR
jgi:DNA repair protein RecO (recombination protein O)